MSRIDAKDRLIVALDVPDAEQAKKFVTDLDGIVSFFKVGLELYTAEGLELVRWLQTQGKHVFLDLKFYDVPATVKRAVARVANLGATFLTVHGSSEVIRAAVEGKGDSSLKILAVTVLTCMDAADIKELYGTDVSPRALVLSRASKAVELGCDGVVASGREASGIRQATRGGNLVLVTPGIRAATGNVDDHKRAATAANAIADGSDYLVIGRPIRDAEDRRAAATAFINEMQEAFDTHRKQ